MQVWGVGILLETRPVRITDKELPKSSAKRRTQLSLEQITTGGSCEPRATRTPSLLIWSLTRYHCAIGPSPPQNSTPYIPPTNSAKHTNNLCATRAHDNPDVKTHSYTSSALRLTPHFNSCTACRARPCAALRRWLVQVTEALRRHLQQRQSFDSRQQQKLP